MTLELLANILTEFALKRNLVNYASFGPSIYELNPKDIVAYPILFLSPTETINVGKNTTTYGFTFYFIDRLLEDSSNETQIFSIGADTLTNFLRQIKDFDWAVEVSDPSIRLFTNSEKMQDRCAGAYTTVNLTVLNDANCPIYFASDGTPIGNYLPAGYGDITTLVTDKEFEQTLRHYTLTENFATINGSAITEGGNIVISGGGSGGSYDEEIAALSAKTNDNASKIANLSASTTSGYSALRQEIESLSGGTFDALTGISGEITELSSVTSGISTDLAALSAYTESIVIPDLSEYTLTSTTAELSAATSGIAVDLETLSAQTSANTAQIEILQTSAVTSTTVRHIWYGTDADYQLIDPKDPSTLYIVQ